MAVDAEATTDAYSNCEQNTVLLTVIEDGPAFDIKGKAFRQVVDLTESKWPEADECGLDLVAEIDGSRRLDCSESETTPMFPLDGKQCPAVSMEQ